MATRKQTRPIAGRSGGKTAGKTPAKTVVKRGEKVKVRETDEVLPVKGVKAPRPGPTVGAAVDRRRQIVQPEDDRVKGKR